MKKVNEIAQETLNGNTADEIINSVEMIKTRRKYSGNFKPIVLADLYVSTTAGHFRVDFGTFSGISYLILSRNSKSMYLPIKTKKQYTVIKKMVTEMRMSQKSELVY